MQQRIVVPDLELVRADQEAVRLLLDLFGDPARWNSVERRLADLSAPVSMEWFYIDELHMPINRSRSGLFGLVDRRIWLKIALQLLLSFQGRIWYRC